MARRISRTRTVACPFPRGSRPIKDPSNPSNYSEKHADVARIQKLRGTQARDETSHFFVTRGTQARDETSHFFVTFCFKSGALVSPSSGTSRYLWASRHTHTIHFQQMSRCLHVFSKILWTRRTLHRFRLSEFNPPLDCQDFVINFVCRISSHQTI
jgi:hypothetical protein